MTRMLSFGLVVVLLILLEPVYAVADDTADKSTAIGTVPADAAGRSLNLGFETGTLADWTAEGSAFEGQPIEGDTVSRRRGDMHSGHAGRFWVGSYERKRRRCQGDADVGAVSGLKTVRQLSDRRAARDLGPCVEIVRKDTRPDCLSGLRRRSRRPRARRRRPFRASGPARS